MYDLEISPKFEEDVRRRAGKNRGLQIRIDKKVNQISQQPAHYKPLGNVMHGLRRVQIGPFVLTFRVDEERRVVKLYRFTHHDEAYEF